MEIAKGPKLEQFLVKDRFNASGFGIQIILGGALELRNRWYNCLDFISSCHPNRERETKNSFAYENHY